MHLQLQHTGICLTVALVLLCIIRKGKADILHGSDLWVWELICYRAITYGQWKLKHNHRPSREREAGRREQQQLVKEQKEHQATRERHINSHRKVVRKAMLASSLACFRNWDKKETTIPEWLDVKYPVKLIETFPSGNLGFPMGPQDDLKWFKKRKSSLKLSKKNK